jgi:plastocyanin
MSEEVEVQLARKDEPSKGEAGRQSFGTAHAPGISWLIVVLLLVLSAFAVIHFGSLQPAVVPVPGSSDDTVTPSVQPRMYTISFDAGVFSPTNLRIHAGDTVRFKNESIFPIRIVSDDLVGFDSIGDIPQGSYFSYTFAARGTFGYRNSHNSDQTGSIIVR